MGVTAPPAHVGGKAAAAGDGAGARTGGAKGRGRGGHNGRCARREGAPSTPGGGAGENEPRHALLGSELDLLGRVGFESRNRRKATLSMGDGKTTEKGQRRVAQAAAALNE